MKITQWYVNKNAAVPTYLYLKDNVSKIKLIVIDNH